jgi:hypothetical protein
MTCSIIAATPGVVSEKSRDFEPSLGTLELVIRLYINDSPPQVFRTTHPDGKDHPHCQCYSQHQILQALTCWDCAETDGLWGLWSGVGVEEGSGPAVAFIKDGRKQNSRGQWEHFQNVELGRPLCKRWKMSVPVEKIHSHSVDICRLGSRCFGMKVGKSPQNLPYRAGVTDHIRDVSGQFCQSPWKG